MECTVSIGDQLLDDSSPAREYDEQRGLFPIAGSSDIHSNKRKGTTSKNISTLVKRRKSNDKSEFDLKSFYDNNILEYTFKNTNENLLSLHNFFEEILDKVYEKIALFYIQNKNLKIKLFLYCIFVKKIQKII